MTAEEARKLQDEWMAAQPKWPQREEEPAERFANEAFAALPKEKQRSVIRNNLKLTPGQRIERHVKRYEELLMAPETQWMSVLERYWGASQDGEAV